MKKLKEVQAAPSYLLRQSQNLLASAQKINQLDTQDQKNVNYSDNNPLPSIQKSRAFESEKIPHQNFLAPNSNEVSNSFEKINRHVPQCQSIVSETQPNDFEAEKAYDTFKGAGKRSMPVTDQKVTGKQVSQQDYQSIPSSSQMGTKRYQASHCLNQENSSILIYESKPSPQFPIKVDSAAQQEQKIQSSIFSIKSKAENDIKSDHNQIANPGGITQSQRIKQNSINTKVHDLLIEPEPSNIQDIVNSTTKVHSPELGHVDLKSSSSRRVNLQQERQLQQIKNQKLKKAGDSRKNSEAESKYSINVTSNNETVEQIKESIQNAKRLIGDETKSISANISIDSQIENIKKAIIHQNTKMAEGNSQPINQRFQKPILNQEFQNSGTNEVQNHSINMQQMNILNSQDFTSPHEDSNREEDKIKQDQGGGPYQLQDQENTIPHPIINQEEEMRRYLQSEQINQNITNGQPYYIQSDYVVNQPGFVNQSRKRKKRPQSQIHQRVGLNENANNVRPQTAIVSKKQRKNNQAFGKRKISLQETDYGYSQSSQKYWNPNFHVVRSKANDQSHPFYREFFDKPSKKYQESVTKSILLEHRRSLQTDVEKIKLDQRIPLISKISRKENLIKEKLWDNEFQIMVSKNNPDLHISQKEFYDKPILLNKKGYYTEMNYQPREIYHQITPIRNIKQAKAYLKCSLDDSHEHQLKESIQNKSLEKKTLQPIVSKDPSIPGLRMGSRKKKVKKLENNWDNKFIGLPISTYNESVFKKFRINFDQLSHLKNVK